ncbi:MAG TPA: hypothetical protein VHU85_16665 [Acidimicrobiales bacterium]|nr:hypothetical protein [Acidimicrobiales bacterium]
MNPLRLRRAPARWAVGLVMVVGCGLGLAACSGNGKALAQAACVHVNRSIALYNQATTDTDPTTAETLNREAYIQLVDALPIAAQAAGKDSQWQALMTTVSESSRVSESHLVGALTDQCGVADQSSPFQPAPTSPVPPPASIPPPATTAPTS